MKVKLQEGYRAVDAVVIRILVIKAANPSKIRLVEELLEMTDAAFKDRLRVVVVEGAEELDNDIPLLRCKLGDGTTLCGHS